VALPNYLGLLMYLKTKNSSKVRNVQQHYIGLHKETSWIFIP